MNDIFVSIGFEQPKYRLIEKQHIRHLVEKMQEYSNLIKIDNRYQFKLDSLLAIFNYHENPIKDKYRTVVLDKDGQFIVTTQSTRQLINQLLRDYTIGGMKLQNHFAGTLGYKRYHVISLGRVAFFSLKGNSRDNSDWVALHFIKKYNCKVTPKSAKLSFSTVKLEGLTYNIVFNKVLRNIERRLIESIRHNHLVHISAWQHLRQLLWCECNPKRKSILQDKELIGSVTKYDPLLIVELAELIIDHFIRTSFQAFTKDQNLELLDYEIQFFIRKSKRSKFTY
ncbi:MULTISPECIES: hypothetical protein [Lactobacillus]|uniref:Uncharacterized protein n=1 Tax=Lactobacillus xujianguonis TaxID=2495899 RepID=A0A437SSG2_9LACO|nr:MULTISPECIES: hypothetical protein [Lactobacillus]RVU69807.1 hypothetical protein EJK17_11120 [Lactobacillus xujianguonis]RVU71885.1 hypothetical protein EJK20_11530 [Lactobacillus xujianguonis]